MWFFKFKRDKNDEDDKTTNSVPQPESIPDPIVVSLIEKLKKTNLWTKPEPQTTRYHLINSDLSIFIATGGGIMISSPTRYLIQDSEDVIAIKVLLEKIDQRDSGTISAHEFLLGYLNDQYQHKVKIESSNMSEAVIWSTENNMTDFFVNTISNNIYFDDIESATAFKLKWS